MGIFATIDEPDNGFTPHIEKEISMQYLYDWLDKHGIDGFKDNDVVKRMVLIRDMFRSGTRNHSLSKRQVSFTIVNKENHRFSRVDAPELKNAERMDHNRSSWVPVANINSNGKIIIKCSPNCQYLLTNISESDLNSFELRTVDKQGGILYCYNCTPKITEKSKKWRYVFIRPGVGYNACFETYNPFDNPFDNPSETNE